jgi:phosphatidylethanolamine/phosphatidyl-N-methylethanolamine N-methyltransferase
MDARAIRFADESFDHVIAPYVMSVVPEPGRVMGEIRRVCRIGGRVVIVNQFQSRLGAIRAVERAATPASQWVGFRLDLPLGCITETLGLETERVERVNMLGMWRLVVMRRVS